MYQVNLSNQAKKGLRRLDSRFRKKVIASLLLLKTNPLMGEKMGGEFLGAYRIKIPPARIIYMPDFKKKIILVKVIGHRQGVYN